MIALPVGDAELANAAGSSARVQPLAGEVRMDPEGIPEIDYYAFAGTLHPVGDHRVAGLWRGPRRDDTTETGIRLRWFDGDLSPAGSDILVDSLPYDTDSTTDRPVGITTAAGLFVVAWSKTNFDNREDNDANVMARVFAEDGEARGEEFRVNEAAENMRRDVRISGGTGEQWIAAYQHYVFDPYDYSVRVQLMEGDQWVGPERSTVFEVGGTTQHPDVVWGPGQPCLLVWSEARSVGSRLMGSSCDGTGELQPTVLFDGAGRNLYPVLARSGDGDTLLAWRRESQDGNRLHVARLEYPLSPVSPEHTIWEDQHPTDRREFRPSLAVSPSGDRAVLVWEEGTRIGDHPDRHVVGRLLDGDGAPLGAAFDVPSVRDGVDHFAPSIYFASEREFVVGWTERSDTQVTSSQHTHARRFEIGSLVPMCGDANDDGFVLATDALVALRSAVGVGVCDACLCDANGSGVTTALDALTILRAAVEAESNLLCPACPPLS